MGPANSTTIRPQIRHFPVQGRKILNNMLGSPEKRFWASTATVNILYTGYLANANIGHAVDAFSRGDLFNGLICTGLIANHMVFSYLTATMPTCIQLGRLFLKNTAHENVILDDSKYPELTVQIPCRNEPFDIIRNNAISSAMKFDYPKGKLTIQVLDNSDADRYGQLEAFCTASHTQDRPLQFIHRDGTKGAKAANLNMGISGSDSQYFLLLDADNKADPMFAKEIMSEFIKTDDNRLAYVFASVDYYNQKENVFTNAVCNLNRLGQTLQSTLDKYGGAPFTGFGVALKRTAIEDAGYWNEDSIAEDWGMSYSLNERGYYGKRLDHSVIYDAAPMDLSRYKIQQRRWAYGSVQNLREHLISTITSKSMSLPQKLDTLFRHSYYPAISALTLFPSMLAFSFGASTIFSDSLSGQEFDTWNLILPAAIGQPLITYAASRLTRKYPIKLSQALLSPLSVLIGMGAQIEILKGTLSALAGRNEGFRITPKGKPHSTGSLFAVSKYSAELLLGGGLLAGAIAGLPYSSISTFLGVGLVVSPLASFFAETKYRQISPGIFSAAGLEHYMGRLFETLFRTDPVPCVHIPATSMRIGDF